MRERPDHHAGHFVPVFDVALEPLSLPAKSATGWHYTSSDGLKDRLQTGVRQSPDSREPGLDQVQAPAAAAPANSSSGYHRPGANWCLLARVVHPKVRAAMCVQPE